MSRSHTFLISAAPEVESGGFDSASFEYLPRCSKAEEPTVAPIGSIRPTISSPMNSLPQMKDSTTQVVEFSQLSFSAVRPAAGSQANLVKTAASKTERPTVSLYVATSGDSIWAAAKFIQTRRVQSEQKAQDRKQIAGNLRIARFGAWGKTQNRHLPKALPQRLRAIDNQARRDSWIEIEADLIERRAEFDDAPLAVHVGFAELDLFEPLYPRDRDTPNLNGSNAAYFNGKTSSDLRPSLSLLSSLLVRIERAQEAIGALIALAGLRSASKKS